MCHYNICVIVSFKTLVVRPVNAKDEMKKIRKEMSELIAPVVQKVESSK